MSKFTEAVEEVNKNLLNESKLISFVIRLGDISEGTGWEYEPNDEFLVTGDSINEFMDNLKEEVKKREGVLVKKTEQIIRDHLTRALNDKLNEILTGLKKNVAKQAKTPTKSKKK